MAICKREDLNSSLKQGIIWTIRKKVDTWKTTRTLVAEKQTLRIFIPLAGDSSQIGKL